MVKFQWPVHLFITGGKCIKYAFFNYGVYIVSIYLRSFTIDDISCTIHSTAHTTNGNSMRDLLILNIPHAKVNGCILTGINQRITKLTILLIILYFTKTCAEKYVPGHAAFLWWHPMIFWACPWFDYSCQKTEWKCPCLADSSLRRGLCSVELFSPAFCETHPHLHLRRDDSNAWWQYIITYNGNILVSSDCGNWMLSLINSVKILLVVGECVCNSFEYFGGRGCVHEETIKLAKWIEASLNQRLPMAGGEASGF